MSDIRNTVLEVLTEINKSLALTSGKVNEYIHDMVSNNQSGTLKNLNEAEEQNFQFLNDIQAKLSNIFHDLGKWLCENKV